MAPVLRAPSKHSSALASCKRACVSRSDSGLSSHPSLPATCAARLKRHGGDTTLLDQRHVLALLAGCEHRKAVPPAGGWRPDEVEVACRGERKALAALATLACCAAELPSSRKQQNPPQLLCPSTKRPGLCTVQQPCNRPPPDTSTPAPPATMPLHAPGPSHGRHPTHRCPGWQPAQSGSSCPGGAGWRQQRGRPRGRAATPSRLAAAGLQVVSTQCSMA